MSSEISGSRSRPKSKGKNDRRNRRKPKHDKICLKFLQYGKCDVAERCRFEHLTLLTPTTRTRNLCKNVFPHENEMPKCKYVHIDIPKHTILEYIMNNRCETCTVYNRKCPKIHDFELKHVLNFGKESPNYSSESDEKLPEIENWADQVEAEEKKNE